MLKDDVMMVTSVTPGGKEKYDSPEPALAQHGRQIVTTRTAGRPILCLLSRDLHLRTLFPDRLLVLRQTQPAHYHCLFYEPYTL